jgi:hypothetical protein
MVWQVAEETVADMIQTPAEAAEIFDELCEYDRELPEDQKVCLDIDKAWDGLTYLLSRQRGGSLYSFLKSGGRAIVEVDQGFGPTRYFTPHETRELAKTALSLTFEKLRGSAKLKDLVQDKVYPFSEGEDESDAFSYLEGHWKELGEFVKEAGSLGRGLLVYLF